MTETTSILFRVEDTHILAIDNEELLIAVFLASNSTSKLLVYTAILQLIDHILDILERVVDTLHRDLGISSNRTKFKPTIATEAIDTKSGHGDSKKASGLRGLNASAKMAASSLGPSLNDPSEYGKSSLEPKWLRLVLHVT